jgi:hypothetical protein
MPKCPLCKSSSIEPGPFSFRRKGVFSCVSCGSWLIPTNASGMFLVLGILFAPLALGFLQYAGFVQGGLFFRVTSGGKTVATPLGVLIIILWVAVWITIWWKKMARFVIQKKMRL